MPYLPCRCENGHRFSRRKAEALGFVCDKCEARITCPERAGETPSPAAEEEAPSPQTDSAPDPQEEG